MLQKQAMITVFSGISERQTQELQLEVLDLPILKRGNETLDFSVGEIVETTDSATIVPGVRVVITHAEICEGFANYRAAEHNLKSKDITKTDTQTLTVTKQAKQFISKMPKKLKNRFRRNDIAKISGVTLKQLDKIVRDENPVILRWLEWDGYVYAINQFYKVEICN